MPTTTLVRKAVDRAQELGGTLSEKAGEVRETVTPKARELAGTIRPKAEEAWETIRPKAEELGSVLGERTKETRRRVGYWIAGEQPRKPRRWPAFAAAGIGALAAYFLDPVSGKRRRVVTRDWLAARVRAAGRRTARLGRGASAYASGYRQRLRHSGNGSPPENDATLTQKVRSEVFQGLSIPAGQININAENGVVSLRGTVERPSQIVEIERRVWDVTGVRGVENLLHLAGTPAPSR